MLRLVWYTLDTLDITIIIDIIESHCTLDRRIGRSVDLGKFLYGIALFVFLCPGV